MKIRIRSYAILLIGAIVLPLTTTAQHFPPTKELASLIQKRVDDKVAVGIVLGVIEADGSTQIVSAGEAGPGANALGELSIFELCSITKAFTGVLLAEMVRRGEVKLSDSVSSYLPDSVRVPSRNGRDITLLDLATHHSGLPYMPRIRKPEDPSNPYAGYSIQQLYTYLSEYQLHREVGAEFEYSNLGAGLLGHALSQAEGTSYEEAIHKYILEPLGMTMTGIKLDSTMSGWMTKGHDLLGNVVPLGDIPAIASFGTLRSNMHDMLRFLAANIGEPKTPLEHAMRTAQMPYKEVSDQFSIGLCWSIHSIGNSKIIRHLGSSNGFRAFIGFDPDRQVGVVILANSAYEAGDIGMHLINNEIPLAPPIKHNVIVIKDSVLKDYVGKYALDSQTSITVTLEEGVLFLEVGRMKFSVYPESETKFFPAAGEGHILFKRDAIGDVIGLIVHQGDQDTHAKKI